VPLPIGQTRWTALFQSDHRQEQSARETAEIQNLANRHTVGVGSRPFGLPNRTVAKGPFVGREALGANDELPCWKSQRLGSGLVPSADKPT
jgi:hypothetical protein